jgi:hypothetical protein
MADVFGAEDHGNGRVLVDCGHGDCCSIPTNVVLPTGRVEWRCATSRRGGPGARAGPGPAPLLGSHQSHSAAPPRRGVVIQVPGNVPGALECRYGPTWRVPRYMDKGADTGATQRRAAACHGRPAEGKPQAKASRAPRYPSPAQSRRTSSTPGFFGPSGSLAFAFDASLQGLALP